jgi:hypothetical protein
VAEDPAVSAWESMLIETHGTADAVSRRDSLHGPVIVALRTIAFLLIAALAILVLLPAALTAQAAIAV